MEAKSSTIIYQHDDNDEAVLLNFMPANLVTVSYR